MASAYSSQKPMSLLVIGQVYVARVVEDGEEGWYRIRAKELIDREVGEFLPTNSL